MAKRYIAKEGLLHHGIWRELDADGNVIAEHGKLPIAAGTRFEIDGELRGRHARMVTPLSGPKTSKPLDDAPVAPGPDEMDDLTPTKKLKSAGMGNGGPPKKGGK